MSLSVPLATESSTADYHTALNLGAADSSNQESQTFTITRTTLIRIIAASVLAVATIIAITVAAVYSSTSVSGSTSTSSVGDTAEQQAQCPLAHILTEGPYWVDEKLDRQNITAGEIGLPLHLILTVYNQSAGQCFPSVNSQVDIWHTNADGGLYSDIASEGTKGQTWLRGYQYTDKSGTAVFDTLYPSWYRGRTTHIHVRIRLYNGATKTYDQTTQLFMDDDISNVVFATYPYNKRTGRDTYNRNDNLYRSDLVLSLKGDAKTGYVGTFALGIPFVR